MDPFDRSDDPKKNAKPVEREAAKAAKTPTGEPGASHSAGAKKSSPDGKPSGSTTSRLGARQREMLRHLQNRRWGRVMAISVLAAIGGGLIISDALLPDCEHEGCPAVERLRTYRPPEPPQIFDADGELAGQLKGPRRIVVGVDSIAELVREGYI